MSAVWTEWKLPESATTSSGGTPFSNPNNILSTDGNFAESALSEPIDSIEIDAEKNPFVIGGFLGTWILFGSTLPSESFTTQTISLDMETSPTSNGNIRGSILVFGESFEQFSQLFGFFDFNLASESEVNQIEVRLRHRLQGNSTYQIDYFEMRVNYTPSGPPPEPPSNTGNMLMMFL
jgi:hypothetical protein